MKGLQGGELGFHPPSPSIVLGESMTFIVLGMMTNYLEFG